MNKTISTFILVSASVFMMNSTAIAQVKVGSNPTQIVTGAKLQVDGDNTTATPAKLIVTGTGNTGVGTAAPGTVLDVNGAVTNRETALAITANAATVPANVSQVQLTGAATATITVTAPAAPNAGQRLVVYNNTTGGFGALLNNFYVPSGQAVEFSYSASGWRAQQVKYAQVFRAKLNAVNGITVNNNFTAIPFDPTFTNPQIVYNTILGSSVNNTAGTISLPAGTYRASGSAFISFNSVSVAGTPKYASLILNMQGSAYNDFGWNVPGSNSANLQSFVNGTCILQVPVGATYTVGLMLYTVGLDATNTASVAGGGIPLNVFEVERLD